MKIYIRTTGERKLDESIEREIGNDYQLLIDKEHRPVDSFIEQLKIISNEDSLLLEDDIILCKDFLKEVKKAIRKWEGFVINFYTYPFQYMTTVLWGQPFCFNQCTYYPKGISEKIANKMIELRKPYSQYDVLESNAMVALEILHVVYRPCLVQHIDKDTLIQKNHAPRRTIWFKDYLEELGISYKDAWTKENRNKLINLMNKKFNFFKR